MRRLIPTTFLVLILSISLIANSTASILANTACQQKGLQKISGGKKFTCTKLGKFLRWDSGKLINNQATNALPANTSYPEVTFSNLTQAFKGIPYWGWKKSSEKTLLSKPTSPELKVLLSPNSPHLKQAQENAISLVSQMYADFPQVNQYTIVYYSFKDVKWAQKYVDEIIGSNAGYDTSDEASKLCQSEFNCTGAAMLFNQISGIPLTLMTTPSALNSIINADTGVREAHEYSHSIQFKQFIGRNMGNTVPPPWVTEGGAEFIQIASIHSGSYANYQKDRKQIISDLHFPSNINKNWLNEFLNPVSLGLSNKNWDNYDGWRVYDVGFLVSEILVSIAGPNSIMDLFKSMGDGLTFQKSFEKIYGLPWSEALNSITNAIVSELS
ncbi:MAG: hypothetical protein NTZ31_01795 [Actinobacteria bacterium]|jgi:hypothetical protein|nr:hypothetical protein [Actinomycetota bacterium]